ncbi:MAG: T9SS type A sorting domain-containing protein [Sphingomonadales bacterium]|nr:T9SS type A sorting domain-containing protein [Sphingomonadales bacterium]
MKRKNLLMTAIAIFGLATITMAQTIPSYVPTNGLVGWWPFNGNANDESGNGNNGTVNGAILATDRFGNANKAYTFNGTTSYIKVNNSSSLESANLSITFWIKSTGNQFQQVFYKVTPNTALNETYSVPLNLTQTGTLNFDLKNNNCNPGVGWQYCSGNIGNISSWTNFVLTHDGSITSIYKNGQLLSTIPGAFPVSNCPGGDLLMGCDWQMNNKLNGQLDDIGIWNRALTQQEITNLYTSSNVGISEVNQSNLFSVFPNPIQNVINVKADIKLIGEIYSIYDNNGKLVLTGKLNSQNTTIELGNLSSGIYMFSVGENMKQTFKVIKE